MGNQLIAAFPSLDDLRIEHFIDLFNDRLKLDANYTPPNLRLRQLKLLTGYLPHGRRDDFFDWILKTGVEKTLKKVTITLSKQNLTKCAHFLQSLGPQLEYLEMTSILHYGTLPDDEADIISTINLAAHTGLKALTFTGIFGSSPVALALLSQADSPQLQQIIA